MDKAIHHIMVLYYLCARVISRISQKKKKKSYIIGNASNTEDYCNLIVGKEAGLKWLVKKI